MLMRVLLWCLSLGFAYSCVRNGKDPISPNDLASLEQLLGKLMYSQLQGKTFVQPAVTEQNLHVDFDIDQQILGQKVRMPFQADLLQSYKSQLTLPTEQSNYNLKVTEIVRLGDQHYQITTPISIKNINASGHYGAKLKHDILGNPQLVDSDLNVSADVSATMTVSMQWQKASNGNLVVTFKPVHDIKTEGERKVSAGQTKDLVRFDASIDRLEVTDSAINKTIDNLKSAIGDNEADKLKSSINNLALDAANDALKKNKTMIQDQLMAAITSANGEQKLQIEGFLSKLAVRVLLP